MKYCIFTYGCQMNKSDAEKISTKLKEQGHNPVNDAAEADLIVVNFCSVRQSAVHRALAQLDKYKNKQLIAAGCLLPEDQKKLAAKNITIWHPDDYFLTAPLLKSKFSAFVPIMTGCNNFCSYCAVPFTRGREKSRPAQEIINEIKQLLKKGVKEIILLGQNVNSYKDPISNPPTPLCVRGVSEFSPLIKGGAGGLKKITQPIDFPELLQLINSLPGNFWLSFISSHPKDLSDKMIKTMVKCRKITPYLHLPIQSGDDKILRAMNRHYTVAHYKKLVKKIRSAFVLLRRTPSFANATKGKSADKATFPPLAVSTDIIVGFPNESNRQFQNTIKLIKEINFDMVYFARYSPRPGSAAAKLKDNVLPKEKMRRAQAINSLLKQQALSLNKKYINQKVDVFIEKTEKNFAFGKTATNKSVRLPKGKLKLGQFVKAK
ncbi:MiaB/RimO family radical SAM methylthiotransferase, partial [Patescibacteria group bacterium]|nr:MiaB/RimO family radical SAM methylthiotransferase [Patescibacteria group bacterium]